MTLGYTTLIGVCSDDVDTWQLGVPNGTPGYWESQMAVERAPALLRVHSSGLVLCTINDLAMKGGCYMAPIWFPLILNLIIDIHVFLVIIPFSCMYMSSFNSAGLFWGIDIFVSCILISPWAPATYTAVLGYFCYIYTNNRWMTPELFFILTYPTYDPTVNFPFNFPNSVNFPFIFLNFHSDALFCHLLFCPSFLCTQLQSVFFVLQSLRDHTSHLTALHASSIAANPVQRPLWQPWYSPPQLDVSLTHPCCTSP